jgi:hypothetical protein
MKVKGLDQNDSWKSQRTQSTGFGAIFRKMALENLNELKVRDLVPYLTKNGSWVFKQ